MTRIHRLAWGLALTAAVLAVPAVMRSQTRTAPVLYENARLIVGDGSPAITAGALLVSDGRIVAVGAKGSVAVPPGATRVDLTGKTVMPTLVNVHVHIGYEGYTSWGAENYTAANVLNHLEREAFYGVGVTQSVGSSPTEASHPVREGSGRPESFRRPRASCSCPAWRRPTAVRTRSS